MRIITAINVKLQPTLIWEEKYCFNCLNPGHIKGAEATCVEIVTETKKCFRLEDMLDFNVLWNF